MTENQRSDYHSSCCGYETVKTSMRSGVFRTFNNSSEGTIINYLEITRGNMTRMFELA